MVRQSQEGKVLAEMVAALADDPYVIAVSLGRNGAGGDRPNASPCGTSIVSRAP